MKIVDLDLNIVLQELEDDTIINGQIDFWKQRGFPNAVLLFENK